MIWHQSATPEDDVLARYAHTAVVWGEPDIIVRLTADCPFVRPEDIRSVVGGLVLSSLDYAWNVGEPRECPDGYDVEALTYGKLEYADMWARDPLDREHVTRWMRKGSDRTIYVPTHTGMGHYRWTLDTAEDLAWMQSLARYVDVTPGVGPTQEQLVEYFEMLDFPEVA